MRGRYKMTKSYSLEEGIQMVAEQIREGGEVVEVGRLYVIGTTNVEQVKQKLEKHTYNIIENSKDINEETKDLEKSVVVLGPYSQEQEEECFRLKAIASQRNENIIILTELPKRIENRFAQATDFGSASRENAAMLFGVTNAGINRLKNRYGSIGIISENELFSL